MTELTIHGLPPSSYVRVAQMVCANKGVDYTLAPVNFRDPAYRDTHPFAKMPALSHGDTVIYETLAIATYIDSAFDGPALQPADPLGKARMMQWISVAMTYAYTNIIDKCVAERFIKPMRGQDPDEAEIAAAMPEIRRVLDVLNDGIAGAYFCGDQISLADLFFAPTFAYFAQTPEGRAELPKRARLTAWMDQIAQSPDYAQINKTSP